MDERLAVLGLALAFVVAPPEGEGEREDGVGGRAGVDGEGGARREEAAEVGGLMLAAEVQPRLLVFSMLTR